MVKGLAVASASEPAVKGVGGCAANAAKVLACHRLVVGFCGGIGLDAAGSSLREGLEHHQLVDKTMAPEGDPSAVTGEVLCLVTPGGERTFAYHPGASSSLSPLSLGRALKEFSAAGRLSLVYFDVYTLLCPDELLERGVQEAKLHGAKSGLNLGSPGIVTEQRERLWRLIRSGNLGVLTMNAQEALALCNAEPAEACREVAQHCELTAVTLGADGVWLSFGPQAVPELHKVASAPTVLDSTGAGDFFAGGLLGAWLEGHPAPECVQRGALAARVVLNVLGTNLSEESWESLRSAAQATETESHQ